MLHFTTSLPWQYGQASGIALEADDLFAVLPLRLPRAEFLVRRRGPLAGMLDVVVVFLGMVAGLQSP